MKWKSYKRAVKGNTKTFLVLPAVDDGDSEMSRNPGLRLFTKTWPPKNEEKDENARPLTATLEKPQVLDIRLVGKIDMSLMKKEFLSLTNLCKIPLTSINRVKPRRKTAVLERRRPLSNLPVAISPSDKSKLLKKPPDTVSDDSWEDESSLSGRDSVRKLKLKSRIRPPTIITAKKLQVPKPEEINNNFKIRKTATKSSRSNGPESIKPLPEPCTTCGRPDLPERFHSHPTTPLKPIRKSEPKIAVKSTVQKPVAIRYKSKLEPKPEEKKMVIPRKVVPVPKEEREKAASASTPKARGPRTLTCYICGREFGTASLPLHEPKCLQKWERENESLPTHLKKQPPIKPDGQMTKEEWNKFAWEASQAALTPCVNCGRTFLPDRLMVHQRSCKAPQRGFAKSTESVRNLNPPTNAAVAAAAAGPTNATGPPTAQCKVCGKLFGTKSIKIHEPQCMKKWQMQNDRPPLDKRDPVAANKDQIPVKKRTTEAAQKSLEEDRPPSSRRPPMFPCYLCGRLFGVSSIYIHEPQCLKKWRIENDKLPPNKRRPEPLKPDIKFTPDGKIDFTTMEEDHWQSHLSQLVPCKHCKRTFNPDRVDVHERNCKGPNQ